ncbi:queuosine precursor transporter [Dethiothermospora halolimnae]|uniref:queuosine precursor transporter n=1 Tax=Dethiothermospora halolimnae TaxID=3114390 RepID=UPI003CCBB796
MEKGFTRENKVFLLLSCLFVTLLVVSNIIASKIMIIGGLMGPAAVLCYAFTFAISDTMAEVWGKEKTTYIVRLGFLASIVAAILIKVAIAMPASPFWKNQSEYSLILGSNIRMVIASMLAYLASQHHDIWAFHFWKGKTKGKYLWIRNNMSTLISQIIDTVIFILVAFYGLGMPLLTMIRDQYILKIIIAIGDTPLVYLFVYMVRRYIGDERREKVIEA